MNFLAAAAQPGIPDAETTNNAYNALIEFGVVGAVLAIILIAGLGIIWYILIISRKRDGEQQRARESNSEGWRQAIKEMDAKHREERKEDKEQWDERFRSYTQILVEKDKTISTIQDKRVELATSSVEAITKSNDRLDELIELIEDAFSDSNPAGDTGAYPRAGDNPNSNG